MVQSRRRFPREFKLRVIRELEAQKSVAEVSRSYRYVLLPYALEKGVAGASQYSSPVELERNLAVGGSIEQGTARVT
jgi:hypothetical protein